MSSQPDNAIDELVAFYAAVQPGGYCGVAVTALIVYDWVVTLPRELQLFWTGKARPLSSILYFTNKYLNLLAQVINLVEYGPISDESCTRVIFVDSTFICFSFLPPAAFAGLRAYALTRNRWLSAFIFLLSSTPFATNIAYFGFDLSGTQVPMVGCMENGTITSSLIQIFFLTNRISTILAETLLIAITWRQFRHEGSGLKINRSEALKTKGLAWVMLCDGLIYFIVLLFLNITNLVLTELAESTAVNGNVSLLARFASPLSSLLVSHFLLDLQDAHQRKAVGLDTDDPLYTLQSCNIRSAHFVPTLGSLGAVIEPAHYSREEHDAAEFFVDVDLSEVPDSAPSGEGAFSQDSRTEDDSTLGGGGPGGSGERIEGV